jgi:hypothetical protein
MLTETVLAMVFVGDFAAIAASPLPLSILRESR